MEYHGKLYGKLGHNQYFETGKTSEDWDNLEKEVHGLKEKISELNAYLEDRHNKVSELIDLLKSPNGGITLITHREE